MRLGMMLLTILAACAAGTSRAPQRMRVAIATNGVRCTVMLPAQAPFSSCMEQTPGRPGVRCSGAFAPGTINLKAPPPPVSYRFSDLGKPGVPRFDTQTSALLQRIAEQNKSKTLRFVYPIQTGWTQVAVYDAKDGPCADAMYQVLNAPGVHNVAYRPGEDPYHLVAYPGDIPTTPFPWMPGR